MTDDTAPFGELFDPSPVMERKEIVWMVWT